MPVLVLARNKVSQKRRGVLAVFGNSPLYVALLLVQRRPPVSRTTKGSVCEVSFSAPLHGAQFSRQFTFDTAEQWVCDCFQLSLGGDEITERPSVVPPSGEAALCRIRRTAPNPASPFHAAFS